MKTTGIIAEYNPFHNGHLYHIDETRRRTKADYIIVAMSGDFVQRGAPALLNKYDRTRMALMHGADLVVELPVTTALSSAEGFARGGISLLDGLGVTDAVSFGCESVDRHPSLRQSVVDLLCEEPEEYREKLSAHTKKGLSFPKARELAVRECLRTDTADLLSEPNNILALEYIRAVQKYGVHMDICMISRQGISHQNTRSSDGISSAAAIRSCLLPNSCSGYTGKTVPLTPSVSSMRELVPASVFHHLQHAFRNRMYLSENDFSDMLFFALTERMQELDAFGSENSDLAHRVANLFERFDDWFCFVELLKSKNRTRTAISRYLTHILLDIRRRDFALAADCGYAPYARVLGFQKEAAPLLAAIRDRSNLPILMQPAKDTDSLDEKQKHLFDKNVRSSELYRRILYSRSGYILKAELRQPVVCM